MEKERTLRDSVLVRWSALGIVAFTMMAAYFVNDIMAPLKTMLEANLDWTSRDFGFFTGAYSFLNVFLLMLIWGGLMLDRFGIRLTGKIAAILMVFGTALQYYGMTANISTEATFFGYKQGVFIAEISGKSIFPIRERLSKTCCCLYAICFSYGICCHLHPPHTPKCEQNGSTRISEYL